MRKVIAVMAASVLAFGLSTALEAKPKNKETQKVVFITNITCNSCKQHIEENLPFEKGVKDVEINVAERLVSVEFDPSKTNVEKLQKAVEKLGYTAEVYAGKDKCCSADISSPDHCKEVCDDSQANGHKGCGKECGEQGDTGKQCCSKKDSKSECGKEGGC